jgi:hypothetical protein
MFKLRATFSGSERLMAWSTAAFPVCIFLFVGVVERVYRKR